MLQKKNYLLTRKAVVISFSLQ